MIWELAKYYRPDSAETPQEAKRFVFQGRAVAAGGHISRLNGANVDHRLPESASSSIPHTGGSSQSASRGPQELAVPERQGRLYSLLHSRSKVEGIRPGGPGLKYATLTQARADGLELLGGKISARSVTAEMESVFDEELQAPCLYVGQSSIDGLTLSGLPADVELDLNPVKPLALLDALNRKSAQGAKRVAELHIVKGVTFPKGAPNGVRFDPPNRIVWEGVGILFLGELMVTDFAQTLTMLRVELGCDDGGTVTAGEVESNGHTLP